MVRRRGVGATLASSMIFSIILISNFAVLYASETRARSDTQANVEDSFYDQAVAIEGAAGINTLVRLQSFLSGRPLICGSALAAVGAEIQGTVESDSSGGLDSYMTAGMVASASATDNLTVVAPFEGALSGALNLALNFRITGDDSAAGVSYRRSETHIVNLPVRIYAAVTDCLAVVSEIEGDLGSVVVANCTADEIGPQVAAAERGPISIARSDGFTADVAYRVVVMPECTVYFGVSLLQSGISGPAGPFNLELQERGSVTLQRPQPQQPA